MKPPGDVWKELNQEVSTPQCGKMKIFPILKILREIIFASQSLKMATLEAF